MKNINRHIHLVEGMLAFDERRKKEGEPPRFTSFEIESIKILVEIVKTIDTLLYVMDRPIQSDGE